MAASKRDVVVSLNKYRIHVAIVQLPEQSTRRPFIVLDGQVTSQGLFLGVFEYEDFFALLVFAIFVWLLLGSPV